MPTVSRFFHSRVMAAVVGCLLATGVLGGVALATGGSEYTGCLGTGGQIKNVAVGTDPRKPCREPQVQITWNQTGPEGPAGADGTAGAAGGTGATGQQGPAGVDGAAGSNGLDGATGPQGPAGADGTDGATGATGPQGTTGPAGATGATGATGSAGAQGLTGAAGPQGPTGATGTTGATGPPGLSGVVAISETVSFTSTILNHQVNCTGGKTLIGGGAQTNGNALIASFPNGNGWSGTARGTSGDALIVYAICANVSS